eukprot:CAMPEP_0204824586 /NCGR_PEP_ID=MMETSP1346-20131115/2576_1 /ASSEMBLY_ACC=CAM_ASM_000771 /TAXON_ID=215587 /ORGANISM="Aplanochytrium stocchinoi, Strain GSBS06" /LENGTH=543 /DNA_ID=CAMNT_0051951799 /DNA_START=67 /DNA_END=1698 /DNA_ORIENTATION=-
MAQLAFKGELDALCADNDSSFAALVHMIKRIVRISRRSSHSRKCITAKWFVKNLRRISKTMRVGYQHDAHEFLRYLTDSLQLDCLRAAGLENDADVGAKSTFVHGVFGGSLESQVQCQHCKAVSRTRDPFLDLSLDISTAQTVDDALKHFAAKEILDVDNQWLCTKCHKKGNCEKSMRIRNAPNTLVIHLKRFGFGRSSRKLSSHTKFSTELRLDKTLFADQQSDDIRYSLYGVLVHSGITANSGHYVAYVKASNGLWYEMDDVVVRQVGSPVVLSQNAYLLFYCRNSAEMNLSSFAQAFASTGPLTNKKVNGSNNNNSMLFGSYLNVGVLENKNDNALVDVSLKRRHLPCSYVFEFWPTIPMRTKRMSRICCLNDLSWSPPRRLLDMSLKVMIEEKSCETENQTSSSKNDRESSSDSDYDSDKESQREGTESQVGRINKNTRALEKSWNKGDEVVKVAAAGYKRKRGSHVKSGAWSQFVRDSARKAKADENETVGEESSFRYDSWDQLLDQGKTKKIKIKSKIKKESSENPFQRVANTKNKE